MAILLFDDSRRAPRSAVGDAVFCDDVVLSPLPRHYQKSKKKPLPPQRRRLQPPLFCGHISAYHLHVIWRALARVAARQRAATALPRVAARQGFNGNARQRAVCERGFRRTNCFRSQWRHQMLPPDALIFSSKCTKMRLAAGLCPDSLGELRRSRRPPSRKKGPTSKGRGREGKGEGRGGKGVREGRKEEGRGRKGGRKGALLISGQRGLFP